LQLVIGIADNPPGHTLDHQTRNEIAVNGKEKRRYPRVAPNLPGVVQIGKGPHVNTRVTEISEGGLKCVFPESVSLGVAAELRFTLPVAIGKECLVVGRVQHYHQDNESYQLGIEFTRVSADVVEAIREFVRQTL